MPYGQDTLRKSGVVGQGGDLAAHGGECAGEAASRHTDSWVFEVGDMEAVVREGGCQRREVRAIVGRAPEAAVDEGEGEASFGAVGAVGGGLPDVVDIGLLRAGHLCAIGWARDGRQDRVVVGVGAHAVHSLRAVARG